MGLRLDTAILAQGAEHENTTTEAVLGSASRTFPANYFTTGKVVKFEALVRVIDNNSTDTLTTVVYFGSATLTTAVASFGATDVADDEHQWITGTIICRGVGAAGTASCVIVVEGADPAASGAGTRETHYSVDATVFDTTVAMLLEVGTDWSVAHADNEVACELFNVYEVV